VKRRLDGVQDEQGDEEEVVEEVVVRVVRPEEKEKKDLRE
jgi:hypothetical protein